LISKPAEAFVIGSKWIYSVKMKSDGTLERYKARLVAQGYKQEYGLDYEETFAPVAKMTTIRVLLTIASIKRWKLHQMDVKNAFLHGELHEVIYMKPPPGYNQAQPDMVCRLRKFLYGLKQAPRAWFEKFRSTIINVGFSQSVSNYSLFIRHSNTGMTILLLHVDGMIITAMMRMELHNTRFFLMQLSK